MPPPAPSAPPPRPLATSLAGAVLLGVAALLASRCVLSSAGGLSATGTGDVSHPPAARAPFGAELATACGGRGEATEHGHALLRRHPYLQLVSERSFAVLWTATGALAGGEVVVTSPAGGEIARARAGLDQGARPEGARQWEARVHGLEPGTLYCYQVLDARGAVTARAGVRTAPAPGDRRTSRLVVFGDSGDGGEEQLALSRQLETIPFDLLLVTGDVAYGRGTRDQLERFFFSVYRPFLRHTPAFPASGNHDYKTDDAAPFREVFALPGNGGADGAERWYSFDWGDAHFVALDTERLDAAQVAWLDADLAATDRAWTVVYGHRPPYSSGAHGDDELVRELVVPVLEKHRVPLFLTGHDHHYERTAPRNGVTYVVTGGGGRELRPVGASPWTAFAEPVHHVVVVEFNARRLSLHAIDGTGREFDAAVFER